MPCIEVDIVRRAKARNVLRLHYFVGYYVAYKTNIFSVYLLCLNK